MRILDTELDYEVHEEVALKRFLGKSSETMENWGQRVWENCRLKFHEKPVEDYEEIPDPIPELLSKVYKAKEGQSWQDRAKELWANKIDKRSIALGSQFGFLTKPSKEQLMKIKAHSKYKTRDEMDEEESLLQANR